MICEKCGINCLLTSENWICDVCRNLYPIYEQTFTARDNQLNKNIEFSNIYEKNNIYTEYLQRNYISYKSKKFVESKLKYVKSCIYSNDCQIMSLLYLAICNNEKITPIKFFFDHSGLMCTFFLF